jgi:hypothetical protein
MGLLTALSVFAWGRTAMAWLELSVDSASATVELQRDGSAIVAHEMMLRVRGGPLKEFVVEGLDEDAELLPDPTITRARAGQAAGAPMPLAVEVDQGELRARPQVKKGLRTGSYLVRFGYRADFKTSERLVSDGTFVLVRWQGPRLANGVDSVRVVIRLPRAERPPRLAGTEGDRPAALLAQSEGVFISTVRQADLQDEIEIVRPHVARGEVVSWKVQVDPRAFDFDLGAPRGRRFSEPRVSSDSTAVVRSAESRLAWGACLSLGLLFGLLVWVKLYAVARSVRARDAEPRALLRMPLPWRITLASVAVGAGLGLAWVESMSTLAGCLLAVAILLAISLPPRYRPPLRGPGEWVDVAPESIGRGAAGRAPLVLRIFDAGDRLGFAFFLVLLMGAFTLGAIELRVSSYHAGWVMLSASLLFPIFCTGRAGELPPDLVEATFGKLGPLMKRLSKRGLGLRWMWRIPKAGRRADELRLFVEMTDARRGLGGLELGCDTHRASGAMLLLPFVIVRVKDGSDAAKALPPGLLFTRGRSSDERVAVLRPRLPTRRMTLALVIDLVEALRKVPVPDPQPSQDRVRAARSSGKGAVAEKGSTFSSPAEAT